MFHCYPWLLAAQCSVRELCHQQVLERDGGLDVVPEMNTSTAASQLPCIAKSHLRGAGDLFDNSSGKYIVFPR